MLYCNCMIANGAFDGFSDFMKVTIFQPWFGAIDVPPRFGFPVGGPVSLEERTVGLMLFSPPVRTLSNCDPVSTSSLD